MLQDEAVAICSTAAWRQRSVYMHRYMQLVGNNSSKGVFSSATRRIASSGGVKRFKKANVCQIVSYGTAAFQSRTTYQLTDGVISPQEFVKGSEVGNDGTFQTGPR